MPWNDPHAQQEASKYAEPIPSRLLILQTLQSKGSSLGLDALVDIFALKEAGHIIALKRRLGAMVRDSQLLLTEDYPEQYRPLEPSDLLQGTVQAHVDGFGFVLIDNHPDLYVSDKEMRLAFHGDRVEVIIAGEDNRRRLTAKIISVLNRQHKQLIGHLVENEDGFFALPQFPNHHQPVTLEADEVVERGLKLGDAMRVSITQWPTRDEYASATIIGTLADQVDTQLIIPTALLDYSIPHEFSPTALAQANAYKDPSTNDHSNRQDLRSLPLVTIDGEDSRDFDDAVYAEPTTNGGYRLVVAIADVSHYVQDGSELNQEAFERGTSVYFPNGVIPMLPEHLSNGLCSLNPHVDRLCMVCDMQVSKSGIVEGYTFYPAVMHSHARLTYSQVAAFLDGDTTAAPDNDSVHASLYTLYGLYKALLSEREKRHALEFETTETYMTFDALGAIDQILPRSRNEAHKLIEECMLVANVAAADWALKHELPVLYRNHDAPEHEKIYKLQQYLQVLGFTISDEPTQADYQAISHATRERPDAAAIHSMLLRSMMQANYAPDNKGHFGLAYTHYTHFTSPIRRYPDLLLHRAIKQHYLGKPASVGAAELVAMGEHTSMTERRADEASRSVSSWLKCHYMQQHIGSSFAGTVTAVTEFGVFVTLTDVYVDGLVHISNLGNEYFVYDPQSQALVGQGSGMRIALGNSVTVLVAGVNLEARKIDFELVQHNGQAIAPGHNRKAQANRKPKSNQSDAKQPTQRKSSKPKKKRNARPKKPNPGV